MGHIRKEELHESLINELEELGNIDLSGKQDKTDESLLTESKDLVGAINELFQSANNGKKLIANAIGEPLSSEDTFSAMSNDINGLLSTFKTNMMNNGITVESGDRFKSLIDKIANMVEEGSGKGIQFASGSVTDRINVAENVYSGTTSLNTPIGFTPTFVFVKITNTAGINPTERYENYFISNLSPVTLSPQFNQGEITLTITGISSNSINLKYERNRATNNGYILTSDWYAIGVGEEDTTLRDSLADILENKGVDVTEEDDMASLITKVDTISGGLDVISATTLPTTGRENQICVLSDNPVDNFMLTSNYNDKSTDMGIITLYVSNTASNDATDGTLVPITTGNLVTNYYFSKICQGDNRLASYIYQNNNWNLISRAYIAILDKGYYVNQSFHGSITSGTANCFSYSTAGNGIYSSGSYTRIFVTFEKKINFTLYSTIKIKTHIDNATNPAQCFMYMADTTYNNYGSSRKTDGYKSFSSTTIPTEITFDISTWTGEHYLAFETNSSGRVFITDLYLY